jgi:hypothetical protein
MFEPENELELALVEATKDPARRASFLRQLLDAEVFVALSVDRELETKPDGTATVPTGAVLTERVVTRDGVTYMAFFSAASRARAIFTDTHLIAPDQTRTVFERHPGAAFVLNPGSDYGRDFPAAEVGRLLAGDFAPAVDTVTVTKPTQVLISQPLPYPTELTDALKPVFADHPAIRSAYLAQVDDPDTGRHPVIGIELIGSDWRTMMDGLRVDLPRAIPDRRVVDFVPCPGGPFDGYFSKIEPFYRRTAPAKGWRQWFSRRG